LDTSKPNCLFLTMGAGMKMYLLLEKKHACLHAGPDIARIM
jgi:hypothetical protein